MFFAKTQEPDGWAGRGRGVVGAHSKGNPFDTPYRKASTVDHSIRVDLRANSPHTTKDSKESKEKANVKQAKDLTRVLHKPSGIANVPDAARLVTGTKILNAR